MKWRSKAFKYKLDAENFRTAFRNEQVLDMPIEQCTEITIADFHREWIETMAGRLAASTLDIYKGVFDRLRDFYGPHRPLRDITAQQAEKFIAQAEYRYSAHKSKNELAESSRRKLADSCKALFNKALQWDYIKINPFLSLGLPEATEQRFHKLTAAEENALREGSADATAQSVVRCSIDNWGKAE